jgi:hypothetical protein
MIFVRVVSWWIRNQGIARNPASLLITSSKASLGNVPILRRILFFGKEQIEPHLIADVTLRPVCGK